MAISEIGTSSIYWAQLSRFYLRTEIESNLQNVVFLNILDKDETMDNVQEYNIYTNLLSSQTLRSYF
jgi:hypothetical protein